MSICTDTWAGLIRSRLDANISSGWGAEARGDLKNCPKKNYTEISIRQKLKRWLTGQKKSSLCRILYKTVVYSSLRETFEENRSKWCRDIRKVSLKQTTQLEKGTWTEYGVRPLLATLWCLVRTGRWLAAAVVLRDRVFILGQMLCKQTFQRVNNKETRTTGLFSDKTK